MKIYVVYGTTGEYEDYRTWDVKAFKNKTKASRFKRKLNKISNEIFGCFDQEEYLKIELEKAGDVGVRPDSNGVEYNIFELECEE